MNQNIPIGKIKISGIPLHPTEPNKYGQKKDI
jgi:hypothetical protein